MKLKKWKLFVPAGIFGLLFVLFTILVLTIDVRPIGPKGTFVGLATINQRVFERIGVHLFWYEITDWLGLVSILIALGFALLGLGQLILRKSIKKVDRQIILLGIFYMVVICFYILFEHTIVNYRPILIDGVLEASYPSSHTILVICIMATAVSMFDYLLVKHKSLGKLLKLISIIIIAITIAGRLISGVHWFSDIIGGILLSAALVTLYEAVLKCIKK